MFIHSGKDTIHPGWYGNIIPPSQDKDDDTDTSTDMGGNCMFVPLPGVAPLCGMVATRSISKGEEITTAKKCPGDDIIHKVAQDIAKEYAFELGELMAYLQMAYSTESPESSPILLTPCTTKEKQEYHTITESYPNVEKIHSNPDIYTIADFLSQNECERLITKARVGMQPCLVKNAETGAVEPDPSRTSTNANIPQREVPSISKKILDLTNCREEQMEILQVLRYEKGQEFQPHTDGFEGPTSACGFLDSGRLATVFCYLNDVGEGGTTLFTKLGVGIKPMRGMAVVHFPMSLDLVEDERTEHQGSIAVDEKWILTTWIWKHWKADYRYCEENLEVLSEDII